MTRRFPFIATGVCLIAVFILSGLGTWQLKRLVWKNNLQAELDTAYATQTPPALSADDILRFSSERHSSLIKRATVRGHFNPSQPILVHGVIVDGQSAVAVVVPFLIAQSHQVLPVEIGCTTNQKFDMHIRVKSAERDIVGLLRIPRSSFATPINVPEKNEWWRYDAEAFSKYWRLGDVTSAILTAENPDSLYPDLKPCSVERKFRNDHLSYAIFWFTMAGVLVIMWGLRFLKPYLHSA